MTGVDMAPHQVALTLFAFFIIWIVVVAAVIVGPDADPQPETTVVESTMEATTVAASEATTVAAPEATTVAASEATHVAAASAAEATAVATTTAAATVACQGGIRVQQANRGQRQQGYHCLTKHNSLP
jgi:hypothetical protein